MQENRSEPYNEVWCVFDVETTDNMVQVENALKDAEALKFKVAISNPCFEVWLIAHFLHTTQSFLNCTAAERTLNSHWTKSFQCEYQKNLVDIYTRLEFKRSDALKNAKAVLEKHHQNRPCQSSNSSTTVYRLVNRLLGNVD